MNGGDRRKGEERAGIEEEEEKRCAGKWVASPYLSRKVLGVMTSGQDWINRLEGGGQEMAGRRWAAQAKWHRSPELGQ